jgi:tRNA(Ile2) C34 agmatinyltransferase TiaS
VNEASKLDAEDERPPICPACGVTMGIILDENGATDYACLECGFSDETRLISMSDDHRGTARVDGRWVP